MDAVRQIAVQWGGQGLTLLVVLWLVAHAWRRHIEQTDIGEMGDIEYWLRREQRRIDRGE